jgi:DNA-binding MarR family transcriptional regulator
MYSLMQAARTLEAHMEEALATVELSMAKFGALSKLVAARAPLPLSELAAQVSCVRSNMTQLVDRLEAEGLVRRVDDPEDRRSVRAEITALGQRKHAAGVRVVEVVQTEFVASLPKDDQAAFERVLSALS